MPGKYGKSMKQIEYNRTEYIPNSNLEVVKVIMNKIVESELEEFETIKSYTNEEFLLNRKKIEQYIGKINSIVQNLTNSHFEQREFIEEIIKERDKLENIIRDLQNS